MIKGLDYLMISLSSGCISNCNGCNKYLKDNKLFNIKIIKNHVNRLKKIGFIPKSFMFFNYDYFNLNKGDILSLYNALIKVNKFVTFHTELNNISVDNYNFAVKNNIEIIFQKNLSIGVMKKIFSYLNKLVNLKFKIVLWSNEYNLLVTKLIDNLKLLNFSRKGDYKFVFNNLVIDIFFNEGERINIKRCFFDNLFVFNDEFINFNTEYDFFNYFEIMFNGDIRIHEPPCGYGNLIISNIYRDKEIIVNDFKKFNDYMMNFLTKNSNLEQNNICNLCNKNKYSYKIMDNKF